MAVFGGKETDKFTWDIKCDVICIHGTKLSGTECNRVRRFETKYDFYDTT